MRNDQEEPEIECFSFDFEPCSIAGQFVAELIGARGGVGEGGREGGRGRSDGLIVGARRSGRIGSGVSPPHFLMVEKIQSKILKQHQHGRL